MPAPYSQDLRDRVLAAYTNGMKTASTSRADASSGRPVARTSTRVV